MLTLDTYMSSNIMLLCMYVHVHVDVATEYKGALVCNMQIVSCSIHGMTIVVIVVLID